MPSSPESSKSKARGHNRLSGKGILSLAAVAFATLALTQSCKAENKPPDLFKCTGTVTAEATKPGDGLSNLILRETKIVDSLGYPTTVTGQELDRIVSTLGSQKTTPDGELPPFTVPSTAIASGGMANPGLWLGEQQPVPKVCART